MNLQWEDLVNSLMWLIILENQKHINVVPMGERCFKLIMEIILSLGRCSEMKNMGGYKLDGWILNEVHYTQSILLKSYCKIRFPYSVYLEGQANKRLYYFHLDRIWPITHFYKNGRIDLEILFVPVCDFIQKYHRFAILFPFCITEDEPVYHVVYQQLMPSIMKNQSINLVQVF